MKKIKRLLMLLLSVMLTVGCVSAPAVAAGGSNSITAQEDSGEMNFDVVFAIDGSGSMKKSDPDKLAEEAVNLFVDMCDQKTCRAGFVVYSHQINKKQALTALSDSDKLKEFKKSIAEIDTPSSADTDIALGLTEAMKIAEDGMTTGRNPLIVLLSDGNTDLPKGPRTVEESNKELKNTLQRLSEDKIPVYTIGLNHDGSLDTKNMENISKSTNGKSYETKKASELPSIINHIFADFNRITVVDCNVEWNGDGYEATIPISNSSVYIANIVILTEKGISDPKLYTPGGSEAAIGSDTIKLSESSKYTLLKMIFPEQGNWTLKMKGKKDDNLTVSLLSSYSLALQENLSTTSCQVGETVAITAGLYNDDSDSAVQDEDLMNQITASCEIEDENGTVNTFQMEYKGEGIFGIDYLVEASGIYQITSVFEGDNGAFEKISKTQRLVVDLTPLSLRQTSMNVAVRIAPLAKDSKINLSELATYDSSLELTAEVGAASETDVAEVTILNENGQVYAFVKGAKTGQVNVPITLTAGTTEKLTLSITVKSGMLLLLGIIALVLIMLVIAFVIYKATRPKLPEEFYISILLPSKKQDMQPMRQQVSVYKKSNANLLQIIEENDNAKRAFTEIIKCFHMEQFLKKCVLTGMQNDNMRVTVNPIKDEKQKLDGEDILDKKRTVSLGNSKTDCSIIYDSIGCSVKIEIKRNAENELLNRNDTIFGSGNNGGFGGGNNGGFGGGNNGGFGGGNNGGFGSDNGGFGGGNNGGFGGGNNGGFGGDNSGGFGGDNSGGFGGGNNGGFGGGNNGGFGGGNNGGFGGDNSGGFGGGNNGGFGGGNNGGLGSGNNGGFGGDNNGGFGGGNNGGFGNDNGGFGGGNNGGFGSSF